MITKLNMSELMQTASGIVGVMKQIINNLNDVSTIYLFIYLFLIIFINLE